MLTEQVIDDLAGPMPIVVSPADRRVILARQERHGRWILHLLSDGDVSVDIHPDYATPTKIAGRYPADGWSAELKTTLSGVRVEVRGNAKDRLLVPQ